MDRPQVPWTRLRAVSVLLLCLVGLAACGGTTEAPEAQAPGTLSLLNETDLGMAPLTVEAFFFQAAGAVGVPPDLLGQALDPGAVVIVGLFTPGVYNGVAQLEGGEQIAFNDVQIRAGQPTNLRIP